MNIPPKSTPSKRRLVSAVVLLSFAAAFVLSSFGQGGLAPGGPPAPTMKTLDQLDTAIAQTNAKVDQSNTKIDQANTKIDALAAQGTVEKFSAVTQVTSTGAAECVRVDIEGTRLLKLESIAVTTFQGSGTAHFTFAVSSGGTGNPIMTTRIPLELVHGETRSGNVQMPVWVRNSLTTAVKVGEAYGLRVCVDAATGDTITGSFYLTGVYE